MQNVKIICMGKLKEQYLRDACDEYLKRLSSLCKIEVVSISPEYLSENPSDGEIKAALDAEGKKIIQKIPNSAKVYAMCIEGKQMTSEELSRDLESAAVNGKNNAVFIIGSSFGLSDEVKNIADYKLSMSKMTFPHQLARVMLLEQIYRAYKISAGGKYHK